MRAGSHHTEETKRKMRQARLGVWKGNKTHSYFRGWYIDATGYKHILVNERYIPEHVLIAEKALGRKLNRKKNEMVHHINGDKLDNRNCNLMICNRSYHAWLKWRMASLYQEEHFPRL